MEDTAIVDLYWDRSQQAIKKTQEKYGAYCYRIAHNILYSREDSEECVNDTWLSAWNAMPQARPDRLSAFLGKITRNLSLDCYRRKNAKKRGSGEIAYLFDEMMDCVQEDHMEEQLNRKALVDAINGFLALQKQDNRIIFVRRYWYMDSIAAIAERFEMSESKVKSSLLRTRKKLKEHLQKEGIEV